MTVLADCELLEIGPDLIDPFDPSMVQPASIDLTLSNVFRIFNSADTVAVDLADPATIEGLTERIEVEDKLVLHPGEFVLGATRELVRVPVHLVGRVEGKSSLGRLGLIVHATAGYVDPGYEGDITLEMTNLLRVPIILRPGRPICQLSIQRMSQVPERSYAETGRYQGASGAVESRYGQRQDRNLCRNMGCPILVPHEPGKSPGCVPVGD